MFSTQIVDHFNGERYAAIMLGGMEVSTYRIREGVDEALAVQLATQELARVLRDLVDGDFLRYPR